MARGIFVMVPDELYEKLEKFKEELDISGICCDALERAVEEQESARVKKTDRERVNIEVKALAENYLELWEQRGIEDGKKDADKFNYRAFMEVVKAAKDIEQLSDQITVDAMIPGEIYDEILYGRIKDVEEGSPERNRYLKGWIKGVLAKWERIKNTF